MRARTSTPLHATSISFVAPRLDENRLRDQLHRILDVTDCTIGRRPVDTEPEVPAVPGLSDRLSVGHARRIGEIVALLATPRTTAEIRAATGVPSGEAPRLLRDLLARGQVSRVRSQAGYLWSTSERALDRALEEEAMALAPADAQLLSALAAAPDRRLSRKALVGVAPRPSPRRLEALRRRGLIALDEAGVALTELGHAKIMPPPEPARWR